MTVRKKTDWAMLCKLIAKPFDDPNIIWERKVDGCRIKLHMDSHGLSLTARSGTDKTNQFPELQVMFKEQHMPITLDGEIVSATGLSFQEWNQRRFNRTKDIENMAKKFPARFIAFDILEAGGIDLRPNPYIERHAQLMRSLVYNSRIELLPQSMDGVALFEQAKAEHWEGIVGKKLDEAYFPTKRLWLKCKTWQAGTFTVTGFTYGVGKRNEKVGAFYLVEHTEINEGRHVGMVGTGLTDVELDYYTARLKKDVHTTDAETGISYIWKPFPVRIKFIERTNENMLRLPVFLEEVK